MTEEKRKTVLELDMINLCNRLSEPSRSYLLDSYVQLNREEVSYNLKELRFCT